MVNEAVNPKPRQTLPPLPPVRRRLNIPWSYLFVAAVLGAFICFPVYFFGKTVMMAANIKEGTVAFEKEQYDVARDEFMAAMRLTDENDQAYKMRLQIAGRTGEWNYALNDFSTLIKENPDRALSYCYRAQVYRKLQDEPNALRDYYACLEREPDRLNRIMAEQAILVFERRGVQPAN